MTHNQPQDVPTSTETPEQPVTGSGDERTSETASEALMAHAGGKPQKYGVRVAAYGTYFATRAKAREIRTDTTRLLTENPDAAVLVLNFEGVQAITNGVADELVADLVEQQPDRRILVVGCTDEVWDAINTVLTRRGLTVGGHGDLEQAHNRSSASISASPENDPDGHNVHCPCHDTAALLSWLIASGVDVTIGATSHQGGAALKVSLDLDDTAVWKGDDLADLLAKAKADCEREGITP